MSKFVRIDKSEDPKKATIINLDLVAKAEYAVSESFNIKSIESGSKRVDVVLSAADGMILSSVYFSDIESANQWVLKYLGIEL